MRFCGRLDEFSRNSLRLLDSVFLAIGENTLAHPRGFDFTGPVRFVIMTDPELYKAKCSRTVLDGLFDETSRRAMWSCIRAVEGDPVLDALVDSLDPCADLNETRSLCRVRSDSDNLMGTNEGDNPLERRVF